MPRACLPQVSPAVLERVAVCVLLLLAFVPRVRDLGRGFGRGLEGYQGAFFAIAAVNYERIGVAPSGGYPVLNIDLPESPEQWFMYANHSPLTPLLGWAALKCMGPEDWQAKRVAGVPAPALEAPLRLPFLLLHMCGLLALWWVARVAFGKQVALLSLALVSVTPVSALYGTLVNVENPSLPFALLAVAAYGSFVRDHKRRSLALMGGSFGLGCSFTFAPAFCLPFLCLRSACKRRWREALQVGAVGGPACLGPIMLHDEWARRSFANLGQAPATIWDRAHELLGPLLEGQIPLWTWMGLQVRYLLHAQGPALVAVAFVGLLLCLVRALSARRNLQLCRFEWPLHPPGDVDLALPLLAGGCAYLFAFYRHSAEEQWSFQLYLVPGVVLCAARAMHAISLPLQRLRGGIAPLVLVAGSVMLPGLARFESWRQADRAAGPLDLTPSDSGPAAPLPASVGTQLAQLLPPGSIGFHPSCLGLTPASAWYSWRSLFAVQSPEDPSIALVVQRLGLQDAPRFFLVPKISPPPAKVELEALRRILGPATLESDSWQAWALP